MKTIYKNKDVELHISHTKQEKCDICNDKAFLGKITHQNLKIANYSKVQYTQGTIHIQPITYTILCNSCAKPIIQNLSQQCNKEFLFPTLEKYGLM